MNKTGYENTARFYDNFLPYSEREDIDFFVEMAKKTGGPVLELGFGTGRTLIPIAREGIKIVGVDNSEEMAEVCRRNLAKEDEMVREKVELVIMDMKELNFPGKFNLITAPFRSFQHLITVEEQMRTLKSVREHLTDEGRFILDIFNPDIKYIVEEEIGEEVFNAEFELADGTVVKRYHQAVENNLLEQVKTVRFIYKLQHEDGSEEEKVDEFKLRYLFRYEAEHLLVRCGFEIEDVYCDYKWTQYGNKYPGELVFVAKKG